MRPVKSLDEILGHPLLSERLFFPRRHAVEAAHVVRTGDGAELSCVLRTSHPGAPCLVYFHGNGETVTDGLVSLLPALGAIGLNVLLAEYRGYAASTGTPSLPALLDDVEPVVRSALDALDTGPEQLVLFGRSLGSLAAIHGVRCFPEAAGLILESAIADPLERILLRVRPSELGTDIDGLRAAVAARLDVRGALERFKGAVLVLHARGDTLVSVEHGRRLHQWAGPEARLEIFERGDHNTLLWENEDAYLELVRAFIAGLAGARG